MLTINEIKNWSLKKCNEELGAACHYSCHTDVEAAREACIEMAREMGMLHKRQPTDIRVYWDKQDRGNEGWAYNCRDDDGMIDSGALDSTILEHAIEEVCRILRMPGIEQDFGIAQEEGGYAIWTAAE